MIDAAGRGGLVTAPQEEPAGAGMRLAEGRREAGGGLVKMGQEEEDKASLP